jgi:hypothetical protein
MSNDLKVKPVSPIIITVLICSLIVCLSYSATSIFTGNVALAGSGMVASTENLAVSLSSVDWGVVAPNSVKTVALTVSNVGNCPLKLNMSVVDWSPMVASEHFTVAWNCTDTVLGIGESVNASLTLYVPDSTVVAGITAFSNKIVITGVQA